MSIVFKWNEEDYFDLLESCNNDDTAPYILKYMPKDGLVVEAGCGLGRYVKYLSDKGYRIIGIELSQESIDSIKKIDPKLEVKQGDVTRLPFKDSSISGMISLGVVEHFIDGPQIPLKEAYRVLNSGKFAIFTVPSFNYIRKIKHVLYLSHVDLNLIKTLKKFNPLRKILGKNIIPLRYIPFHSREKVNSEEFYQYCFTKKEFENELNEAGFEIIESVSIALMDGIYHEFGEHLVKFKNWKFYPTNFAIKLNNFLKNYPFSHNHMLLSVVKK